MESRSRLNRAPYPGEVPRVQVGVQGSEFLEVAVRGGGRSRPTLQPDNQRFIVIGGHVGGGVVEPPEHVRGVSHFHVSPFLVPRPESFPRCGWKK